LFVGETSVLKNRAKQARFYHRGHRGAALHRGNDKLKVLNCQFEVKKKRIFLFVGKTSVLQTERNKPHLPCFKNGLVSALLPFPKTLEWHCFNKL
jgi:hypothetical protein